MDGLGVYCGVTWWKFSALRLEEGGESDGGVIRMILIVESIAESGGRHLVLYTKFIFPQLETAQAGVESFY